ncbi:serine/threonine protein kinase [Methylohalomonas lacus]|uniref:Serine/threonine protein kinase n=1 Tax=Methylohalomonas lacus TaxID=398773 RepID=A0AAE3L3L5_9GAMM|nr:serine/threonine-protein kinase [Methylohalomonas lacus]MCS3902333.1 serine/threonine protein kinase [Methylohalomonas lacus]
MTDAIPEKLGKYDIVRQIGRGSMGIVYEGYDPYEKRRVAVKVALAESLRDKEVGPRYRKMFFNEAHTAGRLRHPNIVQMFDAGVDGDACYIVMELVDHAETLRHYCRAKNLLPYKRVIEIIFICAKTLDYAHRKGVIHRDIKPSNILLTQEGMVKISDFSIAHLMTADTANTLPTGFVGSPRYMSPEQVQEDTITNQTDLFSLGIIMYELLTGSHPFAADTFSRLIHKITNEAPPPLRTYRSDMPDILEKIIFHSLQKLPAKRYKMGLNLAADLSLAFDHLEQPETEIEIKEKFNTIRDLDFFADFSDAELWEIVRACSWQEFAAGEVIISEGGMDDSFFILLDGVVEVRKNQIYVGLLEAGDCFGEMGYLTKAGRSASIVARTGVSLMKINATLIEQVSTECQLHFTRMFMKTLVRRLADTTSLLAAQSG